MKSGALTLTMAATLALAAACGGGVVGPTDPVPVTSQPTALTALPRALTSGEQAVIGAANGFSLSLFRQVNGAQAGANVFTSPLSASMALGMTMNGAANATYDQMRSALGFGTASESDIDQGYKSLIALLRGLDPSVDFRIANSIWYRDTYPFAQSFLDAGTNYFDAKVSALDFASPSAVSTINAWVNTATNSRIPTIISDIDPNLMMVLVNAMYFKGAWRDKFDVALTADAPFHGATGDRTVRLMRRNATMSYASTTDFDAVDLPYGNTAFTMTVLLPRSGKSVETLASAMQASDWTSLTSRLHPGLVDLYLPRFTVTWERQLNGDLQALGMRDAFVANGADFTRMSPRGKELSISYVKQKTFVDVNEEGTEAAAVTSVGIVATSAQIPLVIRVDRPFIFVIRERLSGTVLFMGKIVSL